MIKKIILICLLIFTFNSCFLILGIDSKSTLKGSINKENDLIIYSNLSYDARETYIPFIPFWFGIFNSKKNKGIKKIQINFASRDIKYFTAKIYEFELNILDKKNNKIYYKRKIKIPVNYVSKKIIPFGINKEHTEYRKFYINEMDTKIEDVLPDTIRKMITNNTKIMLKYDINFSDGSTTYDSAILNLKRETKRKVYFYVSGLGR